ncbi:glycosyltransferase family 2 protein [Leifsonia sp. NPDC058230]|uniref:glycosyltransferase family 2 protein n=1 Tax=Leifsonia sp. NPDC058230 TaxID=3346391 RepID=UPI0036DCCC0C
MAEVSVALCTYNGERFLGRQLASILEQTVAPAEIVVADDGSSDGTLQLVGASAAETSATALIVLPPSARLGVTKNFERAISATSAPIVALSDQDDVWADGKLAAMTRAFDDPDVALVHSDARLVDEDGRPLGLSLFEALEISAEQLELEQSEDGYLMLLRRNLTTGATMAFRRELLDVARPFPADWVHDEWLAMIAAATARIRVLPEQLIDYRQHGSNAIGVVRPTLSHKVRRVVGSSRERNRTLADKFTTLSDRLAALGPVVRPGAVEAARAKAAFEASRAAYPANRLLRVFPVLRMYRSGAYQRFASRGTWDVVRDILQKA